jgi:primosomal protein N' (replication factor Y)
MVAKGHHFEGVALAAVVDADTGMALPTSAPRERTFQLVHPARRAQRPRRARGACSSRPTSRTRARFALAARHAVDEFLAGEIERRRELGYPPFRHLVRIVVSGPGVDGPTAVLTELRAGLEGLDGDLLGPAPLLRLRNRSRRSCS